MTFADDLASDQVAIFATSEFAVDASYRALGTGVAATIQLIPNERSMQVVIERGNQRVPRRATFLVRTVQVSAPARTDTLVIVGGDFAGTWVVTGLGPRQGGTVHLEVVHDEVREFGGSGGGARVIAP